jgi:hypothetical protein
MRLELKKSFRQFLAVLALTLLMIPSLASADIVISYGTVQGGNVVIDLLPNTPNQAVQFFATGVAAEGGTTGLELDLQIGDGGGAIGGTDAGPVIGTVDLITGTIWAGNGATQTDVVNTPLAKQSTVDTSSLVTADGLVGTVEFDTTGFSTGMFDFRLTGVAGAFDTMFVRTGSAVPTTAPNGFLRISESVPEPSSLLVILACGLPTMLGRRRRER